MRLVDIELIHALIIFTFRGEGQGMGVAHTLFVLVIRILMFAIELVNVFL